jgi:hypothetical protein
MKGYLQRMAANAVRPQGGIHPLLGSIYGGPSKAQTPHDASLESGSLEEERLVSSPQPIRAENDARVESDAAPFRRSAKNETTQRMARLPVNEDSRREEERIDAQATRFRPLLGKTEMQGVETRRYVTVAGTDRPARSDADFEHEYSEPSRTHELNFPALLPRESRRLFAGRAGERAKSEAFARSAPTEREPDRVQIHIGRIEVTAVPQDPPRPAATRPRKSLNLGEYLKRRDGRAG